MALDHKKYVIFEKSEVAFQNGTKTIVCLTRLAAKELAAGYAGVRRAGGRESAAKRRYRYKENKTLNERPT
jgi:hypothetical protein